VKEKTKKFIKEKVFNLELISIIPVMMHALIYATRLTYILEGGF